MTDLEAADDACPKGLTLGENRPVMLGGAFVNESLVIAAEDLN